MFNKKLKKATSIFKLINTYFLKNKVGLIISSTVPFLFMIIFFIIGNSFPTKILWSVDGEKHKINGFSHFTNTFPIFMTLAICPLSMLCIPNMNIEFRNSLLLKNIKANKVSKYKYIAIVFSYFLTVSLLSSLITIILFILFSINNFDYLKSFNWLSIFIGTIGLIIVSISFSLFISNFIKSPIGSQLLGIGIIILSFGFSGRLMGIDMINKIKSLKYMNLFISPIGSSQNSLCMGSFTPFSGEYNGKLIISNNNVFDWTKPYYFWYWKTISRDAINLPNLPENVKYPIYKYPILVYNAWEKIFDVLMPFIHTSIYLPLSLHFFKWSNR